MKRIKVSTPQTPDLIPQAGTYMVSGYKDEATRKVVLVVVNMTTDEVSLPVTGISVKNDQFETYTTDENRSLAMSMTASDNVVISPRSVTTLVGRY